MRDYNILKKLLWFVFGGGISVICYLVAIGIYTRISSDPIIFFMSLEMGIIISVCVCTLLWKMQKHLFEKFTLFVMGCAYFFGIMILAVFGPTFIDRSISYHIAFYSVEEKEVHVEDIAETFSKDIFNKRIHDAVVTGVLSENSDGSLVPTLKAKIIYTILKPLGDLTNSMGTYYDMKEKAKND